jgi:hypothetical protein
MTMKAGKKQKSAASGNPPLWWVHFRTQNRDDWPVCVHAANMKDAIKNAKASSRRNWPNMKIIKTTRVVKA